VKRIVMVLTVALVMAAMVVAMAAPAFAARGPFVGQPKGGTGKQACLQAQTGNNPINPQFTCAGQENPF
jgi:hypothetical protein